LERQTFRYVIAAAVILILHVVGFYGIAFSDWEGLFLQLSPVTLLVTTGILLLFQKTWDRRFVRFLLISILSGYLIELVGVRTEFLFGGKYVYGNNLGPKLSGVPMIMGVLWFLLSYSATSTMKWLKDLTGFFKWRISRAIAGALLMVMLDYCLEPAASNMDFWQWGEDVGMLFYQDAYYPAPLLNFFTWFVFSGLLVWLCDYSVQGQQPNKPALWVLPIQGLFFCVMSLA
jgi:uncharacterized membrane protein